MSVTGPSPSAPGPGPRSGRPPRDRLVHGFTWSAGYLVVTRATALASVPIVLHVLGAKLYAVWVLAGSLVSIQSLFDLGVGSALVRYVAIGAASGSRSAVGVVTRRALLFYVGLSVVVGAPMWFGASALADLIPYVGPAQHFDAVVIIRWAAVAFALTNVTLVLASTLQGIDRVGACYRDQVFGWLAYIPLLLLGLEVSSPAQAVGLAWVGSFGLQLLLLGRSLRLALAVIPCGHTEVPRIREMLSFGTRWQVSAWADFATFQLPRIVGSFALSAVALVSLDVAMRAAQMAAGPLLAFYPTVLPRATALLTTGDTSGLRSFLQRYYSLVTVLVIVGASVLIPLEVPALALWTSRSAASFDPLVGGAILVGAVAHASTGILSSALLARGDVNSVVSYKARQLLLALVLLPIGAWLGLAALAVAVGVVLTLPALAFNARAARLLDLVSPLRRATLTTLAGWAALQVALPMAALIALRPTLSPLPLALAVAVAASLCSLTGAALVRGRLGPLATFWEPAAR